MTSLLVWSLAAWPTDVPALWRGSYFAALAGAALTAGAWFHGRQAQVETHGRGRSATCLLLAALCGGSALLVASPPSWAMTGVFGAVSELVALGWVSLLVSLVHAADAASGTAAPSPARRTWDVGSAVAYLMWAAAGVGALAAWRPELTANPRTTLLGSVAVWALAAAAFAWHDKAAVPTTEPPTASVTLASPTRHRRWPLLGVAGMCGALAACTPTLWIQSLHCLAGLEHADAATPLLMLLGYGVGAKVASHVAQRPATVRLALAVTLLSCAGFFLLGMISFNTLPRHLIALDLLDTDHLGRRILLEMLLTAMVVLPMSLSTGACVPLVAGAVGNAAAGRQFITQVLRTYGAGMLCGAALVASLPQHVELEAAMRAAALLYTLAALVSSNAATVHRKIVRGLDAAALATALVIAAWPRWTVQHVGWRDFEGAQAVRGENGLQYAPRLDNMRAQPPLSGPLEDESSS